MTASLLLAALTSLGHPARTAVDLTRGRILAAIIIREADAHQLDPLIVAAIIARESSFDPRAVGPDGQDFGLMQIRRGGAVDGRHSAYADAALMNPPINIALGVAYLARQRDLCTAAGKPEPAFWVTKFNGGPCRRGRYGREVVAAAERARVVMCAQSERGPVFGIGTAPARAPEVATR